MKKPKKSADDPKPIRLELPPPAHAEFRVMAAKEGKSMAEFARQVILEKIEKSSK